MSCLISVASVCVFGEEARIGISRMRQPAEGTHLFELKARFETWRTSRKYLREPIPDELWSAAADLSRRYPPSLVGRVLKLDPSRLKKLLIKRSARTSVRKKPQVAFVQLP